MTTILTGTGIQFPDNTVSSTAPVDTGGLVSVTTFTSNGTYTMPAGATRVLVQLIGGGGGSAGYCESGGAGGYAEGTYSITAGTQVTVTVGGGGSYTQYANTGGAGGTTSFGSYLSATGGGGCNSQIQHGGGPGGVGSGGQINLYGGTGTGHINHGSHAQDGHGGAGAYGGGGGSRRHHDGNFNQAFSIPIGAGAPGNNCDGGHAGTQGSGGMVTVYAYK